MRGNPSIELLSSGSELLDGRVVNNHASILGECLRRKGFSLRRDTTIPDDPVVLDQVVRHAVERCDVLVVSGGLGPTADDHTRMVMAAMVGSELRIDEASLGKIRDWFVHRDRPVTPQAESHALVIDGAGIHPNPAGLAPGQSLTIGDCRVFLFPGPPREFKALIEECLVPDLCATYTPRDVRRRLFRLCEVGESDVLDRLEKNGVDLKAFRPSFRAMPRMVDLVLEGDKDESMAKISEAVRSLFSVELFSEEDESIAAVVGRLLRQKGETLATAESCTGGLLGGACTDVPGSSEWFRGGMTVYSNDLKTSWLGISTQVLDEAGAVSRQCAEDMAMRVRERSGADWALSVSGIAGPSGAAPGKPVGLVFIGIAGVAHAAVRECHFAGERPLIRRQTVTVALNTLRLALIGGD